MGLYITWFCKYQSGGFFLRCSFITVRGQIDPCVKPQTHAGGRMLFIFLPFLKIGSSFHSTKQCSLTTATTLGFLDVDPYIYSFSSLRFPFFSHILAKALTFPMFFSLLSPFNYPSLWSCALSHKVKVDGLCQEVHPDLHNVSTFSLLA